MAANNSILPFYLVTSTAPLLSKQAHRKDYAFGRVWPLITQNRRLPCFQIVRSVLNLESPLTSFGLYNLSDESLVADILVDMQAHGLQIISYAPVGEDQYDLIIYPGIQLLDQLTPEGQYYAVMSDIDGGDGNIWYSEVFSIQHSVERYIQVKFWHDEPFKLQKFHITYKNPFYNHLFIDAIICKPIPIEEQQVINKDGINQPTRQITKLQHRFTAVMPQYMMEVMRLVWMHNYVQVIFEGETYNVDEISIAPEWIDGFFAKMEFEFFTDTNTVRVTGRLKPEEDTGDYDNGAYDESFLIS